MYRDAYSKMKLLDKVLQCHQADYYTTVISDAASIVLINKHLTSPSYSEPSCSHAV